MLADGEGLLGSKVERRVSLYNGSKHTNNAIINATITRTGPAEKVVVEKLDP